MLILVCNAGSTSLKFKLLDMPVEQVLCEAKLERVGSLKDAIFEYKNLILGKSVKEINLNIPDYEKGIERFIEVLTDKEIGNINALKEISKIGFKTVLAKGYQDVHVINEDVINAMEEMIPLAPVHNRAYVEAVRVMKRKFPKAVMVGAFETSFHKTIPKERKVYGVPYEWYEKFDLYRRGYHGASHRYIAEILNRKRVQYRAISCHLGGSSSICAIRNGESVDSSFGLTVQTGLIHANRVGDMDCDLLPYLQSCGLSEMEITEGMTKKGGLYGISGVSGDLRYIEKAADEGNERAQLAMDAYVYGIVKYIGAFYAVLGGLDYLVFTGGIGENSVSIRKEVCSRLQHLGESLSKEKNECNTQGVLSSEDASVQVYMIHANEELCVARCAYRCDAKS